jgi:hypothetical protein
MNTQPTLNVPQNGRVKRSASQNQIHVWVFCSKAGKTPFYGVDFLVVCLRIMNTSVLLHVPHLGKGSDTVDGWQLDCWMTKKKCSRRFNWQRWLSSVTAEWKSNLLCRHQLVATSFRLGFPELELRSARPHRKWLPTRLKQNYWYKDSHGNN